jgi:two-component system, cell cycle sensor histidine kinase and response regulator CckA
MVVEDEGGIRALVRKILKRQGYTVLEASNGDEAMKICQEHTGKIDLLITDVVMPNIGGRELVDKLKERCGDMKVLYVSGYTDDAGIYAAELPPGTAFLQKPFTLGSLLDKVKDVLSK